MAGVFASWNARHHRQAIVVGGIAATGGWTGGYRNVPQSTPCIHRSHAGDVLYPRNGLSRMSAVAGIGPPGDLPIPRR